MNIKSSSLKIIFLVSVVLILSGYKLPDLGDSSAASLSIKQEGLIGDIVLTQMRHSVAIIEDPILIEYLEDIKNRLASTSMTSGYPFAFYLVRDKHLNAFALPGGHIGIHSGLFSFATSESEFASVLSHEMAHVSRRHIAQMFEHARQVQMTSIAGIAAAILLSTQNAQAGQGALAASLAGGAQSMINFTRENEYDADRAGLQILSEAGFDPKAMSEFFQKLQQQTRYSGGGVPLYLRTHPLTEDRVTIALEASRRYPKRHIPDKLEYHLMRTRIMVQTANVLDYALDEITDYFPNHHPFKALASQYAKALMALEGSKLDKAMSICSALQQSYSKEWLFTLLEYEILFAQQKYKSLLTKLDESIQQDRGRLTLNLLKSKTLLELNQPKDAIPLLQRQIHKHPGVTQLYWQLSRAYHQAGMHLNSKLTEADYFVMMGQTRDAIKLLTHTMNSPTTQYKDKQQLQARIVHLQDLAHEQDRLQNSL